MDLVKISRGCRYFSKLKNSCFFASTFTSLFRFATPIAVAAGLTGTAYAAEQSAPKFLHNVDPIPTSNAVSISADGAIVVGYYKKNQNWSAYRWTVSTGALEDIAVLPGTKSSEAFGVNADGSVIVGTYYTDTKFRPFRWTASSSGLQELSILAGIDNATAMSVSADGSVIVGFAMRGGSIHAVRWTGPSAIMQELGSLTPGGQSDAFGVSADGSVIVGQSFGNGSQSLAYRWTAATGTMHALGTLPGGTTSTAVAVNSDGSVVVGMANFSGAGIAGTNNEIRAFRWTEASGVMQELGVLAGSRSSLARAVSADGSVVVGQSESTSGTTGFRWTSATGMISVKDWLLNNGVAVASDFSTATAEDVSGDGNIVVGQTKDNRAYIARVVPPTTTADSSKDGNVHTRTPPPAATPTPTPAFPTANMPAPTTALPPTPAFLTNTAPTPAPLNTPTPSPAIDSVQAPAPASSGIIDVDQFAKTLAARPNTSLGIGHASTLLNGAHGEPMRNLLEPGRQSFGIITDAGYDNGAGTKGGFGIADIGYGIGLEGGATARLAFGGIYNDFDIDTGGNSIYKGSYIAPEISMPIAGNLFATIGGYYAPGEMSIERGYLNGGAMDYSHGKADLDTWAARLRLDWLNAATIADWRLTPYGSLTYATAKMEGYTESNGSFPASFDVTREHSTVVRAGLDGITDLTDTVRLLARAEAAYRFEEETAGASGSILGLSGFRFGGQEIDQFWMRGGLGAEFDVAGGTASLNVNVTTQGEDPAVWLRSGWKVAF